MTAIGRGDGDGVASLGSALDERPLPTWLLRAARALPYLDWSERTPPRRWVAGLSAVATLAAVVPAAARRPFWLDEIASARVITAPSIGDVLAGVRAHESTPPLWYVLMWALHKAALGAGVMTGLTSLRLVSAVSVAALVGLVVLYASRRLPLEVAVLAGAIIALGSQFLQAGENLRVYGFFGLVSMLFVLALEWAMASPKVVRLAALALTVAVGATTHYFFLFALAAGGVWVLMERRGLRTTIRVAGALAVGLVPFMLYLPSVLFQIRAHHFGFIQAFSLRRFLGLWSSLFEEHLYAGSATADVQLALIAFTGVGALVLWRRPGGRLPVAMVAAPSALVLALWAEGMRIVDARNMLEVGTFAAIAMAAAFASLPVRIRLLAVVAALGLLVGLFAAYEVPLGRTPYDQVGTGLARQGWTPEDPVVFFEPSAADIAPLAWYLPAHPHLVPDRSLVGSCPVVFAVAEDAAGRSWIRAETARVQGPVLTYPFFGNAPVGRPEARLEVARLALTAPALAGARARGATVFHVARVRPPCVAPPRTPG